MRRLLGAGFLADFQLYLIYTALPFKALELGAGPFELGALAALSTGAYAVLVGVFGSLSDRFARTRLARLSCVGFIGACLGFTLAPDLETLYLFAPLAGGSMAPFWPSIQASVADHAAVGSVEKQLGRFNLSWSSGKCAGFLVGGAFVAWLGAAETFALGSATAFTIFFLLPRDGDAPDDLGAADLADPNDRELPAKLWWVPRGLAGFFWFFLSPRQTTRGAANAAGDEVGDAPNDAAISRYDPRAALFRRLGWIANGVAFGVGATLNHHYPRLIQEFGWSASTFGLFLGLTYLTQTLTFAALSVRPELWCFRRAPLYVAQIVLLVAVVSLPLADRARIIVSAFLIGACLGTCYYSSIVYSLHTHDGRGRNAGVHEALIGVGSMLVPFLGGVCARLLDALWAPYAVAGAAIAVALIAQEAVRWGAVRDRGDAPG